MLLKKIDIIAGARPNFMKIAPIIHALEKSKQRGGTLRYRLIHTGQHYDSNMSGSFFEELEIPAPDVNLGVGSGTQAEQTANIMMRYEALLYKEPSDACLVVGDVTSTMACAITAQKLCIPVAHVEAGIRSGDWSMPEEINRMVTDAITNWFFTTSEVASRNLRMAGIDTDRIFFVGNTMIDTLVSNMGRFRAPPFWAKLKLERNQYFVVTLHRPSNVDAEDSFGRLIGAIIEGVRGLPVIFPVHPRTAKAMHGLSTLPSNIHLVDPQSYLEFNYLVKHAKGIITDSGGITEETTVMGVPCMTLRENTERPETVDMGTNELIGTSPSKLKLALDRLFSGQWKLGSIPPLWDGRAAERIIAALENQLCAN
jgi:UDP-N-acetylglucosamine 2-epimerase (non-hydrolysing)